MTSALPRAVVFCGYISAIILLIVPAGATLALSENTLTPAIIPLTPLLEQAVNAKIVVIPSGATTFVQGHSLQMQTELNNAKWSVQVSVDGIPAAQQSSAGSAVFVNGYLLSYSTNRDVSVRVEVDGAVPPVAGTDVVLLIVQELDNGGAVVPGSTITISKPSAPPTPVPTTATIPVITPATQKTPAIPSPTHADGFSLIEGLVAAGVVVAGMHLGKKNG
jgi:hypothetical protein